MEFNRSINRRLHEEHVATLALWSRIKQAFARGKPEEAPLKQAAGALELELSRHFAFEEAELFPRLTAAGDGDMVDLLAEEHVVIRSAARRFQELMRAPAPDAAQVKLVALELAERLASHVQKEEMSLLPALEDCLDEDTNQQLELAYAEGNSVCS